VRSRRLVALALLIAFVPGCPTRADARLGGGVLGAGAAVAAATGAHLAVLGYDCELDPAEDCDTAGFAYLLGALLIAGGATLGYAATKVWTSADDEIENAPTQVASRPAPPPPPPPRRPPPPPVDLPARVTDDETLRFARQAARAASLRQCSAARITLREIAARDAGYHAELTAIPVIAACL
jgi:hypothetical protein